LHSLAPFGNLNKQRYKREITSEPIFKFWKKEQSITFRRVQDHMAATSLGIHASKNTAMANICFSQNAIFYKNKTTCNKRGRRFDHFDN
jgi:hypothetical protein